MNEPKWYFTLQARGGNLYHPDRHVFICTERTFHIGETADCDVRFEPCHHTPAYYATIVRNDDGQSWRIVKRGDVGIHIDGRSDAGYVTQLHDGDVLGFEGQEQTFRFHAYHDSRYAERTVAVRRWPWVAAITALFALIAVLAFWRGTPQQGISEQELTDYEASLFCIRVDSVQYIEQTPEGETLLRPTKIMGNEVPSGTAFLTQDSALVTARHCVEYWLGTHLDLTTKPSRLPEDDVVRWAIEAESFNQNRTSDDTLQILRVYFSAYDFLGERRYSFVSTDSNVHINRQHDAIFPLADFEDDYYWRSIRPYFTESNMSLGDQLCVTHMPEAGMFTLATADEISAIKRGGQLQVCGYPITSMDSRRVTFASGTVKQDMTSAPGCIFFESNINHGFSGGPVLQRTPRGIVCVGIVSRVDSISSGLYKWAVPVSETVLLKPTDHAQP